MSTVLVLGAGASAGSELADVPVIKNFFSKALEIGVSQRSEFEPLWRFLRDALAISVENLPGLERRGFVTVETIFSQVADISNDREDAAGNPSSLMERLIYDILNESTRDYKGGHCSFHEAIVRDLNPSAIITFNYDLIADKALALVCEGWEEFLQSKFDFVFDGEHFVQQDQSSSWGDDEVLEWLDANRKSQRPEPRFPEFLKLHGSLNWYYDITRREMRRSKQRWQSVLSLYYVPLRFAFDTGRIYHRRAARDYLFSTLQTSPPGPLPDEGADLQLAIVPPVLQKGYPSFIQAQWEMAHKELKAADRIVFIGYSIPQLDLAADRMFRKCYAESEHRAKLCVEVVNRNAAILDKVRSIYSEASVHHPATSLREYVEHFREPGREAGVS